MDKSAKINKLLKISVISLLLVLIIGLSYAYFTANISGSETSTTITVSGGVMNIT